MNEKERKQIARIYGIVTWNSEQELIAQCKLK